MSGQKQKSQTNQPLQQVELPVIPNKLYFSIGEVSKLCDLKTHILRYWEQEFSQLAPSKRRGNRRYYQRKDVLVVRQIRNLLYEQGYTIEGARTQLAQEKSVAITTHTTYQSLKETITDLESLLAELE